MASDLGESIEKIRNVESGRTKLSVEIAIKIEKIYGVDFKWLLTGEGEMFREDQNQGAKGANSEGANSIIWLSAANISALAQISKEAIQKAIKKGTWHGFTLITRDAVGFGGRRREVLLSSLPVEVQEAYWQGKGVSKEEAKIEEPKPVIEPSKHPIQKPTKPLMNKAGGACQACGQAYGLDREVRAKSDLLEARAVTIKDKEMLIQQGQEMLQMKNEEIERLKEEIKKQVEEVATLEQLAQEKKA